MILFFEYQMISAKLLELNIVLKVWSKSANEL